MTEMEKAAALLEEIALACEGRAHPGGPVLISELHNADMLAIAAKAREAHAALPLVGVERPFGASDTACYLWPEGTDEHKALRAAYIRGAADCAPKHAGQPEEVWLDRELAGLDDRLDRLLVVSSDGERFVLSGVSAHNIVEIAREWLRNRLSAAPTSPQPQGEPVHERETPVVKPIGQEGS